MKGVGGAVITAYWWSWVWGTGSESAHDDQKTGLARVAWQVKPRSPWECE